MRRSAASRHERIEAGDPACNVVIEDHSGSYDPDQRRVPEGTVKGHVDLRRSHPHGGDPHVLTVTERQGTVVPIRGTIDVVGTEFIPDVGEGHGIYGTFAAHLRPGRC
jgi:hypothetical protein